MTDMKDISICFFEDDQTVFFKPLTLTRPMDDLRVGIYTIREKWLNRLNTDRFQRVNRPELQALFTTRSEPAETVIWINSRLLPDTSLTAQIEALNLKESITREGLPLVLKTDAATTRDWLTNGMSRDGFSSEEPEKEPVLIKQLWDLLSYNTTEINRDIERTPGLTVLEPGISNGIYVHGEYPVYTYSDIKLEPGISFITTGGPVFIGPEATVMAGSLIRGPAAICRGSTVKMGAKVYENTTIGPVCKVGGEINNVIIHSYSNKAHDGYVGNSIFGQWCNLGADTNTSNLKNNYGTIKFTDWHTRKEQDTGEQFLGTVMSDHGKTGINSMLNTGTNCGVCCNLFSHGYPPKLIPSFSWINSKETVSYRFEKAVETMERTMKRRNVVLTDEYIDLMRILFENRDQ